MKISLFLFIIILNTNSFRQWSTDPTINTPICVAPSYQDLPQLVSDGSSGVIITWVDWRNPPLNSNGDIYTQCIGADGFVKWTTEGVGVCNNTITQNRPQIISDGSGGAIIVWADIRNSVVYDIYAQRINSSGVVQWEANEIPVCTAVGAQRLPMLATDGQGGAIITWYDERNGVSDLDIYAQRVNGDGTLGGTTGVDNDESAPTEFSLQQNYPNPFNPSTTIQYAIDNRQFVTLKVYDVLGKEVATLVDEEKSAGSYNVNFNASKLSSGVYFYKLQAGSLV